MKFKNVKISTLLRVGFFFIVLLIALLGIITWVQSDKMAQQTTDMHEHPLAVSTVLGDIKADIFMLQRDMNALIYAENDAERSKIIQSIDMNRANALKQFDILGERYLGPKEDVEDAYNCFLGWNSICEHAIVLLRDGKVKEFMSIVFPNAEEDRQAVLLLEKIHKIDVFARKKANIFYRNATTLNNKLNSQLFFCVGGILLFVFLLFYLLLKKISVPLKELNAVTQNFREGEMEARSKFVSENEFGILAASFNELAETIETDYKLNAKVSKLARMMLSEEDAHRFCHSLLSALIEDTWSQMGAIYLLNDEKSKYEYFECIGMNVAGCKPFSAVQYEGEFGRALATREIQHIKNIPEDSRFRFATVIGEFMPREIITIPVSTDKEVVAVISLANIKRYSKSSLKLINSILDTLNARMGGILAYRKIIAFSQKLEFQNLELESQKKELSAQTSELQEQNIELEMQKKQLDESNKLKTSFLSNMSHELRTPLNSVIALSGVLNRRLAGKVPDEEYSYLNVIERNGRNLLLLINDILDLSRIESGREEMDISSFNINSLIKEVVEMIEPQAKQKNIQLRFFANYELPAINGDYEKSRHILQNIVGNAVKFTEEGFVEVSVQLKDENFYISVRDTGIGIEKENISKIFEEFRQADGSNSRKYGGTGLGLSIARKYAEMLGGDIELESIYGKGSRFTIHLPLQYDEQNIMVKSEENEYKSPITKSQKYVGRVNPKEKTILLVEDTEAVVIQMKDILETQGYNMLVARNGNEALEQIAHQIPDGLILDLMMPGVDGFEVLRHIREEEKADHLPVIILTAKYVTKEELSFLKNNRIHQLIHKGDINKKQLLEAVASMVYRESEETTVSDKPQAEISVSDTPQILVIEDNPDNLITIKALLPGKCVVLEAEDGLTGIEMAKKYLPNLILMDIALPGISGIEALDELRKDSRLKGIPVIAVSANAMKGDREDLMARGFNGYISKPIDNNLFIQVINEWIGR